MKIIESQKRPDTQEVKEIKQGDITIQLFCKGNNLYDIRVLRDKITYRREEVESTKAVVLESEIDSFKRIGYEVEEVEVHSPDGIGGVNKSYCYLRTNP